MNEDETIPTADQPIPVDVPQAVPEQPAPDQVAAQPAPEQPARVAVRYRQPRDTDAPIFLAGLFWHDGTKHTVPAATAQDLCRRQGFAPAD